MGEGGLHSTILTKSFISLSKLLDNITEWSGLASQFKPWNSTLVSNTRCDARQTAQIHPHNCQTGLKKSKS